MPTRVAFAEVVQSEPRLHVRAISHQFGLATELQTIRPLPRSTLGNAQNVALIFCVLLPRTHFDTIGCLNYLWFILVVSSSVSLSLSLAADSNDRQRHRDDTGCTRQDRE